MRIYISDEFKRTSNKNLCFLFAFMFFSFHVAAQDIFSKEPVWVKNINAEKIDIDPLGNLYAIQESSLYKYDLNGTLLYSYSNFSDGAISSVDVSNPMKIMLFYKESSIIIFLDDHLAPISEKLNLAEKGLFTISLASFSSNNQIWLYDLTNMELLSLDLFLNSTNKVHYSFPGFNPIYLTEIPGKMLVLHDPENGLYFFDSFGSFIKSIAVLTDGEIQFIHNSVYYLKNNQLHAYNYVELNETVFPIEVENIRQCLRYRNKWILLNQKGEILIY